MSLPFESPAWPGRDGGTMETRQRTPILRFVAATRFGRGGGSPPINLTREAMRFDARKVLALAAAALLAGTAAACDDGGSTGSDTLTPPLGVTATSTGATSIRVTWNQVPG